MKKSFITYALTFLSLTCYANSSPQGGDEMSLFPNILIGVSLVIFIAVICVIIDIKIRYKKKSEESKDIKDEQKLKDLDKNKINENIDLKKEKEKLEKEIEKREKKIKVLEKQLNEKDNVIASLRSQIKELNKSSSRSSMPSNSSNKQEEDNNEKTGVADNNRNSNPLVRQYNFIELAVINGSLVKAESEQTTYYRSWRENEQIMFEFVNNDRTRKAINNRTVIIEPFCIKLESSKSPDNSEEIETKTPGILNDDFTLKKKAEIIYK